MHSSSPCKPGLSPRHHVITCSFDHIFMWTCVHVTIWRWGCDKLITWPHKHVILGPCGHMTKSTSSYDHVTMKMALSSSVSFSVCLLSFYNNFFFNYSANFLLYIEEKTSPVLMYQCCIQHKKIRAALP